MSKVIITSQKLINLADAVRTHNSISDKLKLPDIPGMIEIRRKIPVDKTLCRSDRPWVSYKAEVNENGVDDYDIFYVPIDDTWTAFNGAVNTTPDKITKNRNIMAYMSNAVSAGTQYVGWPIMNFYSGADSIFEDGYSTLIFKKYLRDSSFEYNTLVYLKDIVGGLYRDGQYYQGLGYPKDADYENGILTMASPENWGFNNATDQGLKQMLVIPNEMIEKYSSQLVELKEIANNAFYYDTNWLYGYNIEEVVIDDRIKLNENSLYFLFRSSGVTNPNIVYHGSSELYPWGADDNGKTPLLNGQVVN